MKMPGYKGMCLRILGLSALSLALLSAPSKPARPNRVALPPALLQLMSVYAADPVGFDRGSRDYKLPEQFEWHQRPNSPNADANVFGDPSKPGMYVHLLRRGANDWSRPHYHEKERIISVIEGTMWIGTGNKFDPDNAVPVKAGGIIHDIANQPHFDGSKGQGFTIAIIGEGPVKSIHSESK